MDIVDDFLDNGSKYKFIKIEGDASKKQFYEIADNNNLLLIKIITEPNSFDEKFDQDFNSLSQYDYFKYSLQLLDKIQCVPNIIAYNDQNGIIIVKKVGNLRLKEYLEKNRNRTEYIYQSLDWLIKLHKLECIPDVIGQRSYGTFAMMKEINIFTEWILKYANNYDIFLFTNEINNIFTQLEPTDTSLNHRDYQLRNIMVYNEQIYVIDTQDLCIGPNYCDIATFLFNPNIIFSMEERFKYAKYFYQNSKIKIPFLAFYKKCLLYGLIRVFKSYGTHTRYFIRNNRLLSLDMVHNNRIILEQLSG